MFGPIGLQGLVLKILKEVEQFLETLAKKSGCQMKMKWSDFSHLLFDSLLLIPHYAHNPVREIVLKDKLERPGEFGSHLKFANGIFPKFSSFDIKIFFGIQFFNFF